MVMNGPTPIMSIMFRAVAVPNPMPRIRPCCSGVGLGLDMSGWSVPADQWQGRAVNDVLLCSLEAICLLIIRCWYCLPPAASGALHSRCSHTAAPPRGLPPVTAERKHKPHKCKLPCHTARAAGHPSALLLRDRVRPAAG